MTPYSRFLRSLAASALTLADELDAVPGPTPTPVPEPEPTPVPTPDPVPVPVPIPEPVPVPPKQSIFGWNAGSCLFWANSRPFRNKALLTSIHYGRGDQQPPARFDDLGNVLSGKANVPIWLSHKHCKPGRYVVSFEGSGSVNPRAFIINDVPGLQQHSLDIVGPVHNLRVELDGDTDSFITQACIDRHRGSGAIRFMDLRQINSGYDADRNHWRINQEGPSPILQQTITPVQAHMMASAAGSSPYWNFHHLDDDGFVEEVCIAFKSLGGTSPIYFEVSNEVFGPFPVGAWADGQVGGRYNWLNRRTKEVGAICRKVLGSRAVIIIGSQSANLGVSQAVCAGGTDGIDCLAIGPYFSWFTPPYPTSEAGILAAVRSFYTTTTKPMVLAQRDFARSHGLRLIAYETGSDTSPERNAPSLAPLFQKVNQSEAMADIYRDFIDFWRREVNDLCLFYCDLHDFSFHHWPSEREAPYPRGRVVQEAIAAGS